MQKELMGINTLQLITFPLYDVKSSFLVVFEGGINIPFQVQRLFIVKSQEKSKRGYHAHKECSQLLIALNGECLITCDDGNERKEFLLNKPSEGLLIPPTIWAEQDYSFDAILLVLTDKFYNENDYMRDYNDFLTFRGVI
ncbi:sugar 3,4-ketoisomerase [Fluviispira multicolorata]|uniref:WxcM-like domain-containing protein n=1 Tax=Fluviispira multicolorata TaxID=2654512 RepID=A0A833N4H3_9BACT|nr:FdtA/QdtA family cupin domain-containing protein [Fluviispira multicolorata]KAB8028015.1 WxcM-like domain-containing protein [Fluviispira multicolorata]